MRSQATMQSTPPAADASEKISQPSCVQCRHPASLTEPSHGSGAPVPGSTSCCSYQTARPPSFRDPYITLLLQIRPAALEKRFWQSATCQLSMRNLDLCFFAFVLINNLMLLRLNNSSLPPGTLLYFTEICWLYILLGALQACCASFPALFHRRARTVLVTVNRTIRLAQTVLTMTSLCACLASGACIPSLHHATSKSSALPPVPAAVRAIYITSGTFMAVLHSTTQRLRFPPQLLFQALYLLTTFRLASVPATHVLSAPSSAPAVTSLCNLTHTLSTAIVAAATGAFPAPAAICTTPLAPWLLVLFTQLYLGFCVPLGIAYYLEHSLKATYLRTEYGAPPAALLSSAMPLVQAVVALLLCGAGCWQLVLICHPGLIRWAAAVDWEGAHSAWYHDLVSRARSAS